MLEVVKGRRERKIWDGSFFLSDLYVRTESGGCDWTRKITYLDTPSTWLGFMAASSFSRVEKRMAGSWLCCSEVTTRGETIFYSCLLCGCVRSLFARRRWTNMLLLRFRRHLSAGRREGNNNKHFTFTTYTRCTLVPLGRARWRDRDAMCSSTTVAMLIFFVSLGKEASMLSLRRSTYGGGTCMSLTPVPPRFLNAWERDLRITDNLCYLRARYLLLVRSLLNAKQNICDHTSARAL